VLWWDTGDLRYALEGTVNGAGSALDWFEHRSHADAHTIARNLTYVDEDVVTPVFVNGVSGVGSPFWRSQQDSYFEPIGDEKHCVAAILESVAFLLAENFALMREREPALQRIRATGGLIESDYLCRCVAALCKIPIERSQQPEATARGLAYLCADMPNVWPKATATTFLPRDNSALATRFARWRELMEKVNSK
jgi:glycerol kinase